MKPLLWQTMIMIFLTLGLWSPWSTGSCMNELTAAKVRSYRAVRVHSDSEGVYVYQAFSEGIAAAAVRDQTFLETSGFKYARMTWIKLSLPWMLHRSDFARSKNQERILKIKISHEFFKKLLDQSVASSFDSKAYASEDEWRRKLAGSDVILQWDPDRDYELKKVPHRHVLQLGFRGPTVEAYAKAGILSVEDITDFARKLSVNPAANSDRTDLPDEDTYELTAELRHKLLMD